MKHHALFRSILALATALTLLLSYTSVLAAGGITYQIIRQPTCTQPGERIAFSANMPNGIRQTIPALGHDWEPWQTTTKATCAHGGQEQRICGRCRAKETRNTAASSHNYGAYEVVVEATDHSAGLMQAKCRNCGATHQYNYYLAGTFYPGDNRPEDASGIFVVEGMLGDLGYAVGKPDDRYDQTTSTAVQEAQREHGQESTGVAYPDTLNEIRRDWMEAQGIESRQNAICISNGNGTHTWYYGETAGNTEPCNYGDGIACGSGTVYVCRDCGHAKAEFLYKNRPAALELPERYTPWISNGDDTHSRQKLSGKAGDAPVTETGDCEYVTTVDREGNAVTICSLCGGEHDEENAPALLLTGAGGQQLDAEGYPLEITFTLTNNTGTVLTLAGCSGNLGSNPPEILRVGESYSWTQPRSGALPVQNPADPDAPGGGAPGEDTEETGEASAEEAESSLLYEVTYDGEDAATWSTSWLLRSGGAKHRPNITLSISYKKPSAPLKAGDVIEATLTVANTGDQYAKFTSTLSHSGKEDSESALLSLSDCAAGKSKIAKISIKVTEEDIKYQRVYRYYAKTYKSTSSPTVYTSNFAVVNIPLEGSGFFVTLERLGLPKNKEFYKEGEQVLASVTVFNNTLEELRDVRFYINNTPGPEETRSKLASGKPAGHTWYVTVEKDDAEEGCMLFLAYANAKTISGKGLSAVSDLLVVPTSKDRVPDLPETSHEVTLSGVHVTEAPLQAGDMIPITLTIRNGGETDIKLKVLKGCHAGDDQLEWTGGAKNSTLRSKNTRGILLRTVVSPEEAAAGVLRRTFAIAYEEISEDAAPVSRWTNDYRAEVFAEKEPIIPQVSLTAFYSTESVTVGDWIDVTLSAMNTGEVPVTLKSLSGGGTEDDLSGWTSGVYLEANDSRSFKIRVKASEADKPKGSVERSFSMVYAGVGQDADTSDRSTEKAQVSVLLQEAKPEPAILAQPKASLNASYPTAPVSVGDWIDVTLTVDNTGDVRIMLKSLFNSGAEDDLSGWAYGYHLDAQDSHAFHIKVKATTDDESAGKVIRQISAGYAGVGDGVDTTDRTTNEVKVEVPLKSGTEPDEALIEPIIRLSVTYPTAPVSVGDWIPAALHISNVGTVPVIMGTLYGCHTEDDPSGWVIDTVVPAKSEKKMTVQVKATSTDFGFGQVDRTFCADYAGYGPGAAQDSKTSNNADLTVLFKQPEDSKFVPTPGIKVKKTETSTYPNDQFYVQDDMITYLITVENTGNINLYNVITVDALDGSTLGVEPVLIPGGKLNYTFQHMVTQSDAEVFGFVANYAAIQYTVETSVVPLTINTNTVYSLTGVEEPSAASPAAQPADRCRLIFTGAGENSRDYQLHLCPEHRGTWEAAEALLKAAEGDLEILKAWQKAEALWRTDLAELNRKVLDAAKQADRPALEAEQQAWGRWLESQKSLLNRMYPDQPMAVLERTVQLLMFREAELCESLGKEEPAWRMPLGGADLTAALEDAGCGRKLTPLPEGDLQVRETLCENHVRLDRMLLKQLAEADPEGDPTELWNRSAGLWQSALSTLLNKRYAQGSLAMQAEIAAYQENLELLLEARREALALRWPGDAAAEAVSMTVRTAVMMLCEP